MKVRFLPLLLPLYAGMAHADDPVTGVYAGAGMGRATLRATDLFNSDFEASDTAFKALVGYRILSGLAVEASYTDYGKETKDVRGVQVGGEVDAFSIAVVGLIPLRKVDLFGRAGLAAWEGTLSADRTGREISGDDVDPILGFGLQYRSGRFAVRAEAEALLLGFEGSDEADADWLQFLSIGVSWRF